MLKIAVCDDDIYHNKKVDVCVKRYMMEKGIEVKVDFYSNEKRFLEALKNKKFDLILLDISMPELSGLEMAGRIRQIDATVTIIFCTVYYDFNNAQRGLGAEAEDFLKKPLSYKKVEMIFQRLNSRKMVSSRERFAIKRQEGIVVIQISDIIFLEIERKAVTIHLRNKSIMSYLTLKEFEKKLGREYFYRCHKSYLVNLDYVEELKNNGIVLCGVENRLIPVSKGRREGLLKRLANIWYNELRWCASAYLFFVEGQVLLRRAGQQDHKKMLGKILYYEL